MERGENDAYRIATGNIYSLTAQVTKAATEAETSKERVQALVDDMEVLVADANDLRKSLKTLDAIKEGEKLVEKVVDGILSQRDFSSEMKGEFGVRVTALENLLNGSSQGSEQCTWEAVGYDKAHGHDNSTWCPTGSFISQIDIDGCGSSGNCPVIGRVRCCKVLPLVSQQLFE